MSLGPDLRHDLGRYPTWDDLDPALRPPPQDQELLRANPYLDYYQRICATPHPTARVPEIANCLLQEAVRRAAVQHYAWAIPSESALALIAAGGPVLEIGAGGGYWAHVLRLRGVDVLALDAAPRAARWSAVLVGGPNDAAIHPDRTLLLCWPPLNTSMAANALAQYEGNTVVYVGEWRAATADVLFHDMLDLHWVQTGQARVPQWFGMHDHCWVYTRRTRAKGRRR